MPGHGRDKSFTETTRDCGADLQKVMARYQDLFPPRPFDADFPFQLAFLVTGGIDGQAEELRLHVHAALWVCAVDWLIDHEACSGTEVQEIVDRCLRIADGEIPACGDSLAHFLAEIRSTLAASRTFADHESAWRSELERMLTAMAREWHWNAERNATTTAVQPTLDHYLDNADNLGSTWANVTHWIATTEAETLDALDDLRRLSRVTQQAIRLLNDLATIERDRTWNDFNAMMLAADQTEVKERITALTLAFQTQAEPVRSRCPRAVTFLRQQLEWGLDYYGRGADVWGPLHDPTAAEDRRQER